MAPTFRKNIALNTARSTGKDLHTQAPLASADDTLRAMTESYDSKKQPIEVNFRELSPIKPGEDRLTHLLHSYPAKLLPNIPSFFLSCTSLISQDQLVYDPFCGSGTVMVEAIALGKRAAGSDANPLARLITSAKTTWIDKEQLTAHLRAIEVAAPNADPALFSPVVSVDKWFAERVAIGLGQLRSAIETVTTGHVRVFFLVCLSQIVKRCSHADPRLSVPVRLKTIDVVTQDPFELFSKISRQNILRIASMPNKSAPVYIGQDARTPLGNSKHLPSLADLIITSPPYAGAQKYIRASSLNIGWLSLAPEAKLRNLERLNIGREHHCTGEKPSNYNDLPFGVQQEISRISEKNATRADIFGIYMIEMQNAATAIMKSLRVGGHLVLVMGDNQICGQPVRTSQYIRDLFTVSGFSVIIEMIDHIKSRGLMTKRNKTAGLISHEHVFVLRRDR